MSDSAPLLGGSRPSALQHVSKLITDNRVNVLLVFVPLGIVAGYLNAGAVPVFVLNFLAIIPLAALLSDTTEALSESTSETIGGLLNATFGNVVELIVAVVALYRGEIRIVQTSMLGSILSNLLLVLGMSFIAGGYNRLQQAFNQTAAQTMSSSMALACISLLIPTVYISSVPKEFKGQVLVLSRLTSLVLLVIYTLYLFFQLKTHRVFFEGVAAQEEAPAVSIGRNLCLVILAVVTVLVAACAEYLVGSIDVLVEQTGMSKTFIGLILIPIVGNAAEHVTAIIMAMKNKIDLAMHVAVGSSMQIALFMTPFLVVWGWAIDQPMSLYFHPFETTVLFVSVYEANLMIQDGESNWFEGSLLVCTYVIAAIAFFYYPDVTTSVTSF